MIPLAKKNPIGPKSGADKPGIFDEDAVQPEGRRSLQQVELYPKDGVNVEILH
jgi:hypothetical protein